MSLTGVMKTLGLFGVFSLVKLSRLVKLSMTLVAVSPEVPVWGHEHMIALVGRTCLPGSICTPMAAVISDGVRRAHESVTGAAGVVGSAVGGVERQPQRRRVVPASAATIRSLCMNYISGKGAIVESAAFSLLPSGR